METLTGTIACIVIKIKKEATELCNKSEQLAFRKCPVQNQVGDSEFGLLTTAFAVSIC